jgi:hypothetical protein
LKPTRISTSKAYEYDLYVEVINIERSDGIPITIKVTIPKKHSSLLNITNIFDPYESALFCVNFKQYIYTIKLIDLTCGGEGAIVIGKNMIESGANVDITFGNKNLTVHESK